MLDCETFNNRSLQIHYLHVMKDFRDVAFISESNPLNGSSSEPWEQSHCCELFSIFIQSIWTLPSLYRNDITPIKKTNQTKTTIIGPIYNSRKEERVLPCSLDAMDSWLLQEGQNKTKQNTCLMVFTGTHQWAVEADGWAVSPVGLQADGGKRSHIGRLNTVNWNMSNRSREIK